MVERVLVTGGTGMLGANLVRALLGTGAQPIIVSRLNSDRWRLLEIADRIAVRELDYRDPSSVERLIAEELPDAICHLASTPFDIVETSALEHFDINLSATIGLLEAVRIHAPRCKFIYTGSCAAYGDGEDLSEERRAEPTTMLGAAKQAGRMAIETFASLYGLRTLNLCLFTPYGPWEAKNRLIPQIAFSAFAGDRLQMTEGLQQRDFLYVDDVVEAFLAALECEWPVGETINICSGSAVSVRNLACKLLGILDVGTEPIFGALPTRPDEIMVVSGNNSRAVELLGWKPKISLEEGLSKYARWLKDNRHFYL